MYAEGINVSTSPLIRTRLSDHFVFKLAVCRVAIKPVGTPEREVLKSKATRSGLTVHSVTAQF